MLGEVHHTLPAHSTPLRTRNNRKLWQLRPPGLCQPHWISSVGCHIISTATFPKPLQGTQPFSCSSWNSHVGPCQTWVSSSRPWSHPDHEERTESKAQAPKHRWPHLLGPLHPIYHASSDTSGQPDVLVIWGKEGAGKKPEKKEETPPQQKLLHVLVNKYHRPILNPRQRHGSQHRSHRSLLVSDLLLRLDPPAMAYVPILQTTVRQSSMRFTLLLRTTLGFIKICSNAPIMGLLRRRASGLHPPDQLG